MRKLKTIFTNSVRSLVAPAFSLLLSLVVIRLASPEMWGDFVERLIVISILIQLLNWGHRDYLIRQFSENPAQIRELFSNNLLTRSFLLIPAIIVVHFVFPNPFETTLLALWLLGAFTYQAINVHVIYQKSYTKQIFIEMAGIVVTFAGLFISSVGNFNISNLVLWFVVGILSKAVISIIVYSANFKFNGASIQFNELNKSLPFLLIGLSGSLISKIDLYILGICANPNDLGKYQILITIIIYFQAIAAYISTPYIKNMYRINMHSFNNIAYKYMLSGVIISLLAVPLIYLAITKIYGIEFDLFVYPLAFITILSVFLYAPKIALFYRENHEKVVMKVNFIVAGISAILTYVLYQYYSLEGALLAVAITQLILVFYFNLKKVKANNAQL